jgi:hypothetical protein
LEAHLRAGIDRNSWPAVQFGHVLAKSANLIAQDARPIW